MSKPEEKKKEAEQPVPATTFHTYTLGKIRADMLDAWQLVATTRFPTSAQHMLYSYFQGEQLFVVKWVDASAGEQTRDLTNTISAFLDGFIAGCTYMAKADVVEEEEDLDEEDMDEEDTEIAE